MTGLAGWALKMMLLLQPASVTPWADSYASTAEVLAEEAERAPLFAGERAAARTLSVLLSVAWFEGRFDPRAKGDCRERIGGAGQGGPCLSAPQSLGMFQIGRSNLPWLNVSEEEILDVRVNVRAALALMRLSQGVCRGLGALDMLGHYASGGRTCGGLRESRHRMHKAAWIFARVPGRELED